MVNGWNLSNFDFVLCAHAREYDIGVARVIINISALIYMMI